MTGYGLRRRGREGEEEIDICSGRRRMEKGKREWKRGRDWFNGRFKTGPPARSPKRC